LQNAKIPIDSFKMILLRIINAIKLITLFTKKSKQLLQILFAYVRQTNRFCKNNAKIFSKVSVPSNLQKANR